MWLEKLKEMKAKSGLTTKEIADQSGIPEPTLEKLFAGSTKDPKLGTMQQLVDFFGYTLDDLNGKKSVERETLDHPPQQKKASSELTDEAMKVAKDYEGLDTPGKHTVRVVIDAEWKRITGAVDTPQPEEKQKVKIIPLFGNSFAAGTPEPDFGNQWEDYEVPSDSKAEFAVHINGDSMEPYLLDGSIALGVRGQPEIGGVGAFLLDGEYICKQFCQDGYGNIYLFSLNRNRKDADVTIWHDSGRNLSCFGRILMDKEAPLPRD